MRKVVKAIGISGFGLKDASLNSPHFSLLEVEVFSDRYDDEKDEGERGTRRWKKKSYYKRQSSL